MIEAGHPDLSIRCQCELIGLSRSTLYYQPAMESPLNLLLMRLIDLQYTKRPFYGYPKMTAHLRRSGHRVNPKRIRRLMRLMDIQAVYCKPRTTVAAKHHKVYPYLLRGLAINQPNQVWCADITYVPMCQGFMYLVAIMDWPKVSLCCHLAALQHVGWRLLSCGLESGAGVRQAGDLQHRSGCSVHSKFVHHLLAGRSRPDQHGWPRSGVGQHLYRAALAHGQVRGHLPAGVHHRAGLGRRAAELLRLLQHRATAPEPWISNTG